MRSAPKRTAQRDAHSKRIFVRAMCGLAAGSQVGKKPGDIALRQHLRDVTHIRNAQMCVRCARGVRECGHNVQKNCGHDIAEIADRAEELLNRPNAPGAQPVLNAFCPDGAMDLLLAAAACIRRASKRASSEIRMVGGISLAFFMRLTSVATHAPARVHLRALTLRDVRVVARWPGHRSVGNAQQEPFGT